MRSYILTPEQRKKFQQLYLLNRLGMGETFSILLPGELGLLTPLFDELQYRALIWIDQGRYRISTLGQESLEKFRLRYQDYLQMYDCYCAVDLGTGEFAFTHLLEYNPEQFKIYLSQTRWEDLRVAVADYKKLDPLEIVFMSFLNEGRFTAGKTPTGWCLDLLGDLLWDDMLSVCRTALHWEDLGTEDVIQDVINQGSQLMIQLIELQKQQAPPPPVETPVPASGIAQQQQQPQYETVTTTETVTYVEEVPRYTVIGGNYGYVYDPAYLYSPFYVAPCWYEPYWYY